MAQPIASQVAGRSRPRQPGSTPRPLHDVGLGGMGLWELVTKTSMFGPYLGNLEHTEPQLTSLDISFQKQWEQVWNGTIEA